MLCVFMIFGPIQEVFFFRIIMGERSNFNCARYMELRTVILNTLNIVLMDVLFRFFYIVHAEKGLVVRVGVDEVVCAPCTVQVRGEVNTRLVHRLYTLLR